MRCQRCILMVIAILNKNGIEFLEVNLNEIILRKDLSTEQIIQLNAELLKIGIEIIYDKNLILVEKIKYLIHESINNEEEINKNTFSDIMVEKLKFSKNYLSSKFRKITFLTIQKYKDKEKIIKIKEMLLTGDFNNTDIADKMHFCDEHYLCHFFRNIEKCTMGDYVKRHRKKVLKVPKMPKV
jgi:AraC family transcriptional regulator